MAWYKIADGPLTIANSPITVTIAIDGGETRDIECSASEWQDKSGNMADSGHVYWYQGSGGGTKVSPLANQFDIYVLDDAILHGYSTSWSSSEPMSGIFVSENVRGITIPPSTVYHKVPAEYLQNEPLIVSVTGDEGNGYTADYSFSEIKTAINNGKEVFAEYNNKILSLSLMGANANYIMFSGSYVDDGSFTFNGSTISGTFINRYEIGIDEDYGTWVIQVPIPCGSFSSNGGGGEII